MPAISWLFLAAAAHSEGDFRDLSVMTMGSLPLHATASSDEASWKHYCLTFNLTYCILNGTVTQDSELSSD